MDIVPKVVKQNQELFQVKEESIPRDSGTGDNEKTGYNDSAKNSMSISTIRSGHTLPVEFKQLDAVSDELPALGAQDLLLMRALMIHQSPADNLKILHKIAASGVGYVLLTTHIRADENYRDFVLAMGHKINLFRAPYCVCDPLILYREVELDTYLGLWDLRDNASCFVNAVTIPNSSCTG